MLLLLKTNKKKLRETIPNKKVKTITKFDILIYVGNLIINCLTIFLKIYIYFVELGKLKQTQELTRFYSTSKYLDI